MDEKNKMNRVFYLGQPGSFSERAAQECFPEHKKMGLNSFEVIFEQLNNQPGTVAVVPIENSLAGIVEEVQALLKRYPVKILGEHPLSIELCLAAKERLQLKQIKRIYSHPKAFQQIKKLLQILSGVETVACQDTASAALLLAEERDQAGNAALISPWCAKIYGLQIIQEDVADQTPNITRFLIISGD